MEFLPDFTIPVPLAFEAETAQFNLQTGDVIYDTKEGYTQANQHECISWCIQVQSSNRGRQGILTLDIYIPNKTAQKLEKYNTIRLTQEDFIGMLQTGKVSFGYQ